MTTTGFPIYDAHDNMTACLFRSGSNYYSLGNKRHYDAWGAIRNGAISGDPKGRYCASLGHKQDDESGLLYMRARYYEPSSGRFLSEDPNRSGWNWFTYCSNNPVRYVDESGTSDSDFLLGMVILIFVAAQAVTYAIKCLGPIILATGFCSYCIQQLREAGGGTPAEEGFAGVAGALVTGGFGSAAGKYLASALGNVLQSSFNALGFYGNSSYFSLLGQACVTMAIYSIVLCGELIMDNS